MSDTLVMSIILTIYYMFIFSQEISCRFWWQCMHFLAIVTIGRQLEIQLVIV